MPGYMPKSVRDDYETPQELFDRLDKVFEFDCDIACTPENCKVKRMGGNRLAGKDALGHVSWAFNCGFLNPPYGRGIEKWINTAAASVAMTGFGGEDQTICMLIPSSTETAAWNLVFNNAKYILFLKGRLRFELQGKPTASSAPKGSAVVVFSTKLIPNVYQLSDLGKIIDMHAQRKAWMEKVPAE